ncbi:MAG TPA: hypothetical protein V6C95_06225 [Coleofasciculaceae cyanobacterium]
MHVNPTPNSHANAEERFNQGTLTERERIIYEGCREKPIPL